MFRTLFAKLSIALVALSLVLSVALVLVLQSSHQSFHLEIEQRLHRGLAERLVSRIGKGEAGIPETFEQIRQFGMLNPALAAYAVDAHGTIVAASRPGPEVKRMQVAVAPILDFVRGPAAWPVLGDDPAAERGKAVFSAARIPPPAPAEFLYVVLGRVQQNGAVLALGDRSYSLREALGLTLVNVAAALVAALIVVGFITRPLRRLGNAMEAFDATRFTGNARYQAAHGPLARDEIDRLGEIFDSMADRIAAQIEALRRSDEARRELYANISHDLETPLTSLHGYVETLLMKDGSVPAAQRMRYLEIVRRQTEQLRALIDQVTDLARLEAPELRLHVDEVRVEQLLKDLLEDLRPLLEEKELKLEFDAGAPVARLRADAQLLRRALGNIVLNAIQAAPQGSGIAMRIADGPEELAIVVADKGPGLRSEHMQRMFEPRYRGERRVRPGSPGMGLGLAIARKVAELHGGTVSASNAAGGGAEFSITLKRNGAPRGARLTA